MKILMKIKWWVGQVLPYAILLLIIVKPVRTGQLIGEWVNQFIGGILRANAYDNLIALAIICVLYMLYVKLCKR